MKKFLLFTVVLVAGLLSYSFNKDDPKAANYVGSQA